MNQIDTSSSSLYFAASSIAASNQASKEAINKTKEKITKSPDKESARLRFG